MYETDRTTIKSRRSWTGRLKDRFRPSHHHQPMMNDPNRCSSSIATRPEFQVEVPVDDWTWATQPHMGETRMGFAYCPPGGDAHGGFFFSFQRVTTPRPWRLCTAEAFLWRPISFTTTVANTPWTGRDPGTDLK